MSEHVRRLNGGGEVEGQTLEELGCTTVFEPGWETDGDGGQQSLCRPMYRDLYGCAGDCWWPAQVPDEMSQYPSWVEDCQAIEQDWKDIDFIK
ncbi:MAG: quinohemoprotein amine dehydrogenase subunit gamma [Vulcanimicrobiota bacterium]